jgi:hypothetical protein
LLRTFPNTQFILTTHSPYIVGSINNHLKRYRIKAFSLDGAGVRDLLPLNPDDVNAYLLTKDGIESLVDRKYGLIDDKLLSQFNEMSEAYETMRDIEWSQTT